VNELRVTGVLARRGLSQTLRRAQFIAPVVVFPTLFLIANAGGAAKATDLPGFPDVRGFLDFELPAAMLQSTMLAGVSTGIAIAIDIENGFIDRLLSAPIRRSSFVFGRVATTAVLGVCSGIWFLAAGLIGGAHIEGGVAGALIVLALMGLSAAAFGGLGAALALKAGRGSTVQGTFPVVFVILFLSSAFFPRQLMEEPAATVAAWNPLSLIATGIRHPIIDGVSLHAFGTALAGIGTVALVAWALCLWGLRTRLGET
jgi:ABC-2 type transport system permease protein